MVEMAEGCGGCILYIYIFCILQTAGSFAGHFGPKAATKKSSCDLDTGHRELLTRHEDTKVLKRRFVCLSASNLLNTGRTYDE